MKSEIINRIIKEVRATSYLEIGYGNGDNYKLIECDFKLTCDPNYKEVNLNTDVWKISSDAFFEGLDRDIDVVFIDGDHTAEQVRKDIANSLKRNAKAIILHDTIPHSKEMQEVPRNTKEWTGDCWRAVVGFYKKYPDVKLVTYRSDYGLTVIYPEGMKTRSHFEKIDLTYEEFKENEVQLLNIID